jgi:CheY-like chemotaxis protein/two-component sensor histidine kinase
MSHEIRTPLNAVLGMTTIGGQARDVASKNRAFAKIEDASTHLLGVINDILDMSKIEAGKLELSNINFRVREVITRVENIMRFKSNEKKQDFVVIVAAGVPDALHGDDIRLAQIMTNLIGNAIKFTPEKGRISLEVFFEGETDGLCTLRFCVRDSGIGISEEQVAKLFTSFQQAESSTTRKYGGTGLGLVLSKRIAEMMGGDIEVDSEPGCGTTFSFTIMAARVDMAPADETSSNAPEEMRENEFVGNVILLVDDVGFNREIIILLLKMTGVTIDVAENGQQAVDLFARAPERYRLILMDLQMPVMDGYEATRRIRSGAYQKGASVPIIAMTANVFREDIDQSLSSGMNGHLGKPLELDKLLPLLRKYLS